MNIKMSNNLLNGVGVSAAILTGVLGILSAMIMTPDKVEEKVHFELISNERQYREINEDIGKLTDEILELKSTASSVFLETNQKVAKLTEQQQRIQKLVAEQVIAPELRGDLISVIGNSVEENISGNLGLDDMENRIGVIESVIVDNPEKAMKLPLLIQKLEYLFNEAKGLNEELVKLGDKVDKTEEYKVEIKILQSQISNLNALVLSLFGGLLVAVMSIGLGNFREKQKSS
ncbi:hypothetical protein ND981_17700 [Vibrio diabolicus]|uniref:hypothetical protein n=1 Tax=Vibrio diabolicus TaxID=50719 RepID=UPI00215EE4DA|nr:hypothetical protein [Vibrio diabolicus]MCS0334763.1 hypothetical protein [Vibrio diabolicus]